MKKMMATMMMAALIGLAAEAQTGIVTPGGTILIPSTPPAFDTNALARVAGFSPIAEFGLGLLPYWRKDATNVFNARELELAVAPMWKAGNAGGATPFVSASGTYFFLKGLGVGAEAVSFGSGDGSSALDSVHAFLVPRAVLGNVAGYALIGGGRDFNLNRYDAEGGVGLELRYDNGVGVFADWRYQRYIDKAVSSKGAVDHSQALRIGVTIHF